MKTINIDFEIEPGTILLGHRGSVAHGLFIPSTNPDSIDDIDYMGIVVPPIENYFGLKEWSGKGTKEVFEGINDIVYYEVRKFINLLLKGNPNVVSTLWLKPEHYHLITPLGQKLIDNRDLFHSKDCFYSFTGYTNEQLKKMGKFNERGFRGEKRKELIERYGYDTKNAAHCIRLSKMLIEIMETGIWNVDRTGIDADEILSVKQGKWSQDRVISEARILSVKAKEAFDKSDLPEKPDYAKASEFVVELLKINFKDLK